MKFDPITYNCSVYLSLSKDLSAVSSYCFDPLLSAVTSDKFSNTWDNISWKFVLGRELRGRWAGSLSIQTTALHVPLFLCLCEVGVCHFPPISSHTVYSQTPHPLQKEEARFLTRFALSKECRTGKTADIHVEGFVLSLYHLRLFTSLGIGEGLHPL